MFDIKTLALLKHGKVWGAKNIVESALLNKWGGASYEKTVGPAPILSISDAKAKPAKSLIVGMEPIQDLHGYDSPWPAGGGKNILDPNIKVTAGTQFGLTITTTDGYNFSSTGTATSSGNLQTNSVVTQDAIILPAGTYIGGGSGIYSIYSSSGSWLMNKYGGTAFTVDEPFYVKNIYWVITSGNTYNTSTFVSLAKGSTAPAAWSPYSNECPISGRTGVTVERTGGNLFDKSAAKIASTRYMYIGADSVNGEPDGSFVLADGNYTLSLSGVNSTNAESITAVDAKNNRLAIAYNTKTLSFTNSVLGAVKIIIVIKSADFISWDNYDIMLNLGSTALPYEPYVGASYPVVFPGSVGTVYGGTVDVVSGVLTVTMAQIASYNGEALPGKWISDRDVYAEGTFPTTGAQVVYELATPITYQLTPTQIQLLKGSNVLWSDGDSLTLTYLGTTPENLLGGMLGGGLGGAQEPTEETSEEPESPPDEQETEETEEP